MSKVRVPVAGTVGKSVLVESEGTTGAQIGVDLLLPDGSTPTLEELADAIDNSITNRQAITPHKVTELDKHNVRTKLTAYRIRSQTPTVAATTVVDYELGQFVVLDLQPASITTLTLSNPPASGLYGELFFEIIQGSTARTITWPGAVKWPGGTAPVLTTTNDAVDEIHLRTRNGGTTWRGSFVLDSK